MKARRIWAMVYRDYLIITRAKWRWAETVYFPLTTVAIWGFFAIYSRSVEASLGILLLANTVFWNFAYLAQSTVNMQMMEDSWSGSLKHILLSGITEAEYILSRIITSAILSVFVFAAMLAVAYYFGFNFTIFWKEVLLLSTLTLIISLSLGVLISGMLILLSRAYGFLSWTSLQALVLLSAPFFPKELFPPVVREISLFMPFTGIFEATRNLGNNPDLMWPVWTAIAYSILVWPFYFYAFRQARKNGNLARLS